MDSTEAPRSWSVDFDFVYRRDAVRGDVLHLHGDVPRARGKRGFEVPLRRRLPDVVPLHLALFHVALRA